MSEVKIVYNIYVAVRKLWNAIFGKNGDGSSVELIKGNPTVTAEAPNLTSIEINGTSYKIELSPEQVQEAVDYYLSGDPSVFENVVAPLIAPEWEDDKAYKVGNLLTYQGKQYEVTGDDGVAPPVGTLPTDTNYFTERPVSEIIEMIKTGEITVGKSNLANNFDSKMVLTDNSGYLYRTTGGSLEVGEQNRVKKIIGASVPIIQYINHGNFDSGTTGWQIDTSKVTPSVSNNVITMTTLGGITINNAYATRLLSGKSIPLSSVGHKIAICVDVQTSVGINFQFAIAKNEGQGSQEFVKYISSNTWTRVCIIFTLGNLQSETSGFRFQIYPYGTADAGLVYKVRNVNLIDLTATFGTTVANRLYALEQAQAGTGIAKAKEILVKDYYPYNVTDFTHTKTTGKQNVGFNLFNITKLADITGWSKSGDYYTGSASNFYTAFGETSFVDIPKNYSGQIQIAFEGYMATAGTGCRFRFYYTDGTTSDTSNFSTSNSTLVATSTADKTVEKVCFQYSNQSNIYIKKLCIDCYWDGERDGEYEPYQEWNYPVQDIELKGILSLDAQDNWVADGDEYLPSGVVDVKRTSIDLSTLEWNVHSQGFYTATLSDAKPILSTSIAHWVSNKYIMDTSQYIYGHPTTYGLLGVNGITLYVTDTQTPTGILEYELATPTESSADSYTELQNDSNWGTEKWIDNRDVPLPVFSTCEYIPDLKAKLETAPESPEEDGDYIMHRENGLNSYGSLSTWLSANGYNKLQDLSSAIEELSGFTFMSKKALVTGKLVTLTLVLKNTSGEDITNPMIIATSALPRPNYALNTPCYIGNTITRLYAGYSGGGAYFTVAGTVGVDGIVYIALTYVAY